MTPAPEPRSRTRSPELMVHAYPNANAAPDRPRLKSSPQDRRSSFVLEAEVRADPAGDGPLWTTSFMARWGLVLIRQQERPDTPSATALPGAQFWRG
jgi:hypothetical protein